MSRKANPNLDNTCIQINTVVKQDVINEINKINTNSTATRNNQMSLGGLINELLKDWLRNPKRK